MTTDGHGYGGWEELGDMLADAREERDRLRQISNAVAPIVEQANRHMDEMVVKDMLRHEETFATLTTAAEEILMKEPRQSSTLLKEICKSQYTSRHAMAREVGVTWGTLQSAMVPGRRPAVRTAKKISDAAGRPDYLEAVMAEVIGGAKAYGGARDRRWGMSMDIETCRNLYNFYQKALRSGVSAPGDVHHEMGKIYRRLKKAGEVG